MDFESTDDCVQFLSTCDMQKVKEKLLFKVLDFGFACKLNKNGFVYLNSVGSPWNRAPEILQGFKNPSDVLYTSKADIWALGVMYYEMLFGVPPFSGDTPSLLLNQYQRKKLTLPLDVPLSGYVKLFLKKCLQYIPNDRWTLEDLTNSDYILNYDPWDPDSWKHI